MQTLFTVSKDEKNHGPFSIEQVSRQFLNGTFSENDYIYIDEKKDWIPLIKYLPEVAMKKKTVGTSPATVETEPTKQVAGAGQKPTQRPYPIPLKLAERAVTDPPREKTVVPVTAPIVEPKVEVKVSDLKVAELKTETKAEAKNTEVKVHEMKAPAGESKKIEFVHTAAGPVQIRVKLAGGKKISLPGPISVVVKAAAATKIEMKGARDTIAGEAVKLRFEALDKFGNVDEEFNDSIVLQASGSAKLQSKLVFVMGRAEASVTDNKAETVHVKMHNESSRALDVSGNCNFVVKPAPTARIEVVGPDQIVAGEAAEFVLKTFDAFNNVTTDFDESVSIEVESRVSSAAA